MSRTTQIGWYNLKEDTEFHDASFETAAWYRNVLVKAGKYPIEVYDYREGAHPGGVEVISRGHSAYVYLEGTVTTDYFGTLFFGNPVGTYNEHKNTGRTANYTKSPYLFQIARDVAENPDTPYELFPKYEPRKTKFKFNGEESTTYGIYVRKGEESNGSEN